MVYLSICIPTYNRKDYLQKTIDSIISQSFFQSGEVEIIVSDNASDDGTKDTMERYIASTSYIRYSQNETNEGVNRNIYKVLNLGTGLYRKISNDTYVFKEGSLERMVDCIKKGKSDRPFLLFSNAQINIKNIIHTNDLDQFVRLISYNLTNDTVLGFWDTELPYIQNTDVWFWTINAIFKIVTTKKNVTICNNELYSVALPKNKDLTYGLIKVFYTAYLQCYHPYIGKEIHNRTYRLERKKLLYNFFLLWFLNKEISTNFRFSKDDTIQNLKKAYGSPLIFFCSLLKMKVFKKKIGSFLRNVGFSQIVKKML